jgi:hypothetical protein
MKQIIADNQNFQLAIDHEKQRLYITLSGRWDSDEVAEEYLAAIKGSLPLFFNRFSLMADFSKLLSFQYPLKNNVHVEALAMLLEGGLQYSAQIMPEDHDAYDQVLTLAKNSHTKLAQFGEADIAELYLDSLAQEYV